MDEREVISTREAADMKEVIGNYAGVGKSYKAEGEVQEKRRMRKK